MQFPQLAFSQLTVWNRAKQNLIQTETRGGRVGKDEGKAYKWVDWETRLGDWETQKQVCLYAERLPSFLLLR